MEYISIKTGLKFSSEWVNFHYDVIEVNNYYHKAAAQYCNLLYKIWTAGLRGRRRRRRRRRSLKKC